MDLRKKILYLTLIKWSGPSFQTLFGCPLIEGKANLHITLGKSPVVYIPYKANSNLGIKFDHKYSLCPFMCSRPVKLTCSQKNPG